MNRIPKTYCSLVLFLFFLLATLFISYCHTEKGPQSGNSCPACHFQNSTIATCPINFFLLPQLTLLDILRTFEIFQYDYLMCVEPKSRAPPQA